MSRYRPAGSRAHRIERVGRDLYVLSWVVDRYYRGSRQRHPRRCKRFTDLAGALRFAKKWGVQMPERAK